ncbi:MAG: TolC family protein [Bacteroidota bacterium]
MPHCARCLRPVLLAWSALTLWVPTAFAQEPPRPPAYIALLSDGLGGASDSLGVLVMAELRALAGREFDLRFVTVEADHTLEGAAQQLERVMNNPEVDLVITLGLLTSQVAAQLRTPPHPVLAAAVFDPRVQGLPLENETSGVPGLAYVAAPSTFTRELTTFREIAGVDTVAILVQAGLRQGLTGLTERLRVLEAELGLALRPVATGASPLDALTALPAGVDGVYVGPLGPASPLEVARLAEALVERGLPSFAVSGRRGVAQGRVASRSADRVPRRARRVAMLAERILLGDEPASFPVLMPARERLTLNLATARSIGLTPPLGLLLEADLVGASLRPEGPGFTLDEAIQRAVEANLAVGAERRTVEASAERVREAQAVLRPQIEGGATGSLVDPRLADASLGQQPEQTVLGQLTLTHLLWAEEARANVGIQRASLDAQEHGLDALQLDVALEAAEAYLSLLRTQALVQIQRHNLVLTRESLELADQREAIGAAGPAESLRLRAELATRRTDLIEAYVLVQTAEIALNQVLNRPLEAPLTATTSVQPDELAEFGPLATLIVDPDAFERLRDVLSAEALRTEPGIQALGAGLRAQERAEQAAQRAFYTPVVALVGQANASLYEGGAGTEGLALPPLPSQPMSVETPEVPSTFWTLGLNVTLPLFEGGGRRARRARARAEVHRLQLERDLVAQRVEQSVRTQLHVAAASYAAVQEARRAAEAARASLDIVTRSYAAGALDVTPLLESQNAARQAAVGVTNAIYDFLVDVKRVERAIGRFEALTPPAEQADFRARLDAALRAPTSPAE